MCIKLLKGWIGLIVLTLTGCAGINGSFDCPYKLGISCGSVSEVNDLVDRGKLPSKASNVTSKKIIKATTVATTTVTECRGAKRIPEKILTIWLAPFVDQDGNYHGSAFLTAVIQPARWLHDGVNS